MSKSGGYIDAAFRSSVNDEAYLFMTKEYLLLNYAPETRHDKIVHGPLLTSVGFPSLALTPFGICGIDCAFDTDHNEAYIFYKNLCALIDYAPHSHKDKILSGPTTITTMFPCLWGTVFEDGIDAAFRSSRGKEAYLFKGDQYTVLNYVTKCRGPIMKITVGFPFLRGTIFQNGIHAAFASHIKPEAYLFKGKDCARINFAAPNTTHGYIIDDVTPIVDYWPSLRGILPRKNPPLA